MNRNTENAPEKTKKNRTAANIKMQTNKYIENALLFVYKKYPQGTFRIHFQKPKIYSSVVLEFKHELC